MNLSQTCTVILEEVSQGLPEDRESIFLGCGNFSNILNPVWKLTKDFLSLSLSSYLLSRLHGRLGESRRESASCVDARDRRHADRWYQTRTYGLRDAGKLIGILTVVLLRRGGLFCTGWGAQARWSAGAQEWRRVTRGHKRGRTVTLARMKRRVQKVGKGDHFEKALDHVWNTLAKAQYSKIMGHHISKIVWKLLNNNSKCSNNNGKRYYVLHYFNKQTVILRITSLLSYLIWYFVLKYIFLKIISQITFWFCYLAAWSKVNFLLCYF